MKGMMSNLGVPFEGATPDLKSPAGMYVIDWFKQAKDADLVPPDAIAWGQSEARGAFVAKKTALLIDGLNGAPDYLEAPDFPYNTDWAMVPTPTTSGGENLNGATVVSSRSWAITAGTKHPDEAMLAVRYLSSKENLFATLEAGIVRMPRNNAVLDSPEMAEFLPFLTEDLKKSFADAEPGPAAANAGEVEGVLEQLLGEIVQGTDASAQELADKYQQQLDALSA
jgi:ABC-type glycerol-3-phosphate transport system substrate-binding protein